MADPTRQKRSIIQKILGRPVQGTPTAATPDELITDADLESLPDDYVDQDGVPILGQYMGNDVYGAGPGASPEAGPQVGGVGGIGNLNFNPVAPTGRGDEANYLATQDFQATPDDRALAGEGPAGRTTGRIIQQGEAPESAFAPPSDPYAGEWWNDPDALDGGAGPTREEAVAEAMFDFSQPMSWGGGGGWNYQYQPDPEGNGLGYILATDPDTGRTTKVVPGTKGRGEADAFAAIMTELHREGAGPLNARKEPAFVAPEGSGEAFAEAWEAGAPTTTPTNTMPVEVPVPAYVEKYGIAEDLDPISTFDAVTGGKYGVSGPELEPAPTPEGIVGSGHQARRDFSRARPAFRKELADRLRAEAEAEAAEKARMAAIQEPIDWMNR